MSEPAARDEVARGYNFAYLDERTKKMIRRALLKAVAIPGHQVPFASREMPLAYGWGTGGIQVTAAVIGREDVLKVIDQGSDDTTNAVNIRQFFARTTGVATTTRTTEATLIQTRHRIPDTPLAEGQVLVYQVPQPEPLYRLEARRAETLKLHAAEEYGLMNVKLYEDLAQWGRIETTTNIRCASTGATSCRPRPSPPSTTRRCTACRRCSCSAPGARSGSTRCRPTPTFGAWTSRTTRSASNPSRTPARAAACAEAFSTR